MDQLIIVLALVALAAAWLARRWWRAARRPETGCGCGGSCGGCPGGLQESIHPLCKEE
ncbi:MAG: FeoB-associated Cys-rich membrane protein [Desulfarculaceae bacterium]|nr:FeoB-associated Cys-rich membrane protein [Desulfarculaceae bacterium]